MQREYKRREFCNDIRCKVQMLMSSEKEGSQRYEQLRELCKSGCIHSTYEFHHWLIDKGFKITQ